MNKLNQKSFKVKKIQINMDKIKLNFANEIKDKALREEETLKAKGKLSIADKSRLSRLFEKAGEAFLDLENEKIAKIGFTYYHKAEEYAPYSSVREDIGKRLGKRIKKPEEYSPIERKVLPVIAIGSLLVSLFFVSSSLTGNAIAELNQDNSRWVGICFFICGLIFSFVYLRNKKKR
jgi:hypothetical protein